MVEGSYEYDVSIILKDGHVTQMSCDCPYAEDGSHCKHMAAVLYKISENGFENYIRTCKENREKEEMYEKLLEEVLKEVYIGTLERYENVLKQKFPIQVRNRYISYVKQCAEQASSRNLYRNLIVYLRKIKDYPDGAEITNKILTEWREKYKRRKAMMEELKMAGF